MAVPAPLTHAEQLIERAKSGELLSPQDRRHVVHWYMVNEPDKPNTQIAKLFQVTEGLIRKDKDKIRKERAEVIKQDDVGLVIADIVMTYEKQMKDLERSKRSCRLGTPAYVAHCRAIAQLMGEQVEKLQRLGFYPLSLGQSVIEKFEYRAIVNEKAGTVNTVSVNVAETFEADFEDVEPKKLPPPTTSEHMNVTNSGTEEPAL